MRSLCLIAILVLANLCLAQQVAPLESPAGASSGQPHLDRGVDGIVRMSWIETEGRTVRLLFSVLRGGAWSAPRKIVEGDRWFVNWADVPSLVADANGNLIAHWLERLGGGTYAYGVRMRISTDGGKTWGKSFWLHDDRSPQEHGFCSILPRSLVEGVRAPGPGFWAVWLDGRAMKTTDEMQLRARTIGLDGKLGKEAVLDPRVCECCPTAVVQGADGLPLVAYRDRTKTDVRDISLVRRAGRGWGQSVSLHADGWERPG